MDTRQTSWPNSLILGGNFPSLTPQTCVQLGKRIRERPTDKLPTNSRDFVEETAIVEAIKQGEEEAFVQLTDRFHSAMIRVALTFCSNRSFAEAVVHDTWMEVLNGLHEFEGHSSLKGWIFGILMKQAKAKSALGHHGSLFSEKWQNSHEEFATPASYPDEIFPRLEMAMDRLPAFSETGDRASGCGGVYLRGSERNVECDDHSTTGSTPSRAANRSTGSE